MKKILLVVVGLIGVLILGVVGMAMTQPDTTHLERSITLEAAPADVAPFAENLEKVQEWSPWNAKDPDLTQSWSDNKTGVGAWYGWEGDEDTVGSGKMTIAAVEPGKVVHDIEFFTPFEGQAQSSILWSEAGDGTEVTWTYDAENNFMSKVMFVFMDIEEMIGPDYEKGLELLEPMVEKAAAERIAAEKAAAEAAAAAAETDEGGEAEPDQGN